MVLYNIGNNARMQSSENFEDHSLRQKGFTEKVRVDQSLDSG